MITIESFFKVSDIFVNANEFNGPITDPNYIAGAIRISVNEKTFLSLDMWDYIDQLWAYISDGVECISKGNEFSTYFPDQPIKLSFVPVNANLVRMQIECNGKPSSVIVEKSMFINSFVEAGIEFFFVLKKALPSASDTSDQIITTLAKCRNQ